ncbi:hypothetical protein C2G38_2206932 [Gigaspora rosea]|uniref:Uncharacterized protein n=1 Tax=Gigaspora rosea TaxID=44941 RepID=A0A397UKX3_9GLOM|nr:hypothetical protein C2G38_2206932 [Gigaspora rosea]
MTKIQHLPGTEFSVSENEEYGLHECELTFVQKLAFGWMPQLAVISKYITRLNVANLKIRQPNVADVTNATLMFLLHRITVQNIKNIQNPVFFDNIHIDNAWALRCRGDAYRIMNRYEESLADLNKSLEIEPNEASTLGRRGDTYCMMGRYEESLDDLNKSLKIEPNNAEASVVRRNLEVSPQAKVETSFDFVKKKLKWRNGETDETGETTKRWRN